MDPVRATVYSIYMPNVDPAMVEAQRSVVEKFLPPGWKFVQEKVGHYSHPAAMTVCIAENRLPVTVFLDIDCIPLDECALELLGVRANLGMLVGAVQRANHINNGGHLYVGPFCMAISNRHYTEFGSPTFYETDHGDVGEEVTYRWREREQPVYFLWPTNVIQPMWALTGQFKFGFGTTYENLFYHEFCARQATGDFVRKCESVLTQPELRGVASGS